MEFMLLLERFSFGVGDRFAHQAKAQLAAFQKLEKDGIHVAPVWNKSNREHTFIGSEPQSVFDAAQAAVRELGWTQHWHIDADHINLKTVDRFMSCSDFFTIDVADSIGKPAAPADVQAFLHRHPELVGVLNIPGVATPFSTSLADVERVAEGVRPAEIDMGVRAVLAVGYRLQQDRQRRDDPVTSWEGPAKGSDSRWQLGDDYSPLRKLAVELFAPRRVGALRPAGQHGNRSRSAS